MKINEENLDDPAEIKADKSHLVLKAPRRSTFEDTDKTTTREVNPMTTYLNSIGMYPLLDRDEEIRLSRLSRDGNEEARTRLIQCNLRLVVRIATDFKNSGMPLMDLISEGNIGLMKALKRYDPDKGAKLSAYAAWWIRQAMKRALASNGKTIRLPSHQLDRISKIRILTDQLKELLGREPTDEEIARELSVPVHKVTHLKAVSIKPASLDCPLSEDGDAGSLGDIVRDEKTQTPSEKIQVKALSDDISGALAKLTPREAEIVRHRFGIGGIEPKTLENVSQHFQITRERVRQIQNIALKKLRNVISEKDRQRTKEELFQDKLEQGRREVIQNYISQKLQHS